MPGLHALLSDDSRSALQRTRRTQLYRIANAYKLSFPEGCPADDLRKIIEGHGVDVTRPLPDGADNEWERRIVEDENGKQSIQLYPKEKPHFTANKDIDYESIIQQRAAKAEKAQKQAETENEDLRSQLEAMKKQMEEMQRMLGADVPSGPDDSYQTGNDLSLSNNSEAPDISTMPWKDLKAHAKALGLKAPVGMKRPDLEALIRGNTS